MKKIKSKPSLSIDSNLNITEKKEPYEVIYADARDEEIQLKFLKRAQLNARMARWFLDREYNKLLWSDGIFEILELDPRKYGANYSHFLEVVHPDDRQIRNQAQQDLLLTTKSIEINYRLLFKDGGIKWINEICNTDFDQEGHPICSYGIIQDITERRIAEQLLQENEIRLKELIATKDKFFSIIAHDLRSPFNSIIGFLDLLLNQYDDFDETERKSYLKLIDENAIKTLKLLDNLLEWAKSQTGKISFQPIRQKLFPVVENVKETLDSSLNLKLLTLNYSISDQLEIFADTNMLTTIFQNLISNAIKYSHPGGIISINAKLKNDQIEVSVSDTGTGMSNETKNKLFRIDEQVSVPGTANEKGSGLGLILCKDFIEKHKGTIWVESEPETGTRFIFRIPNEI